MSSTKSRLYCGINDAGLPDYVDIWIPDGTSWWPYKAQYILFLKASFPDRIARAVYPILDSIEDNQIDALHAKVVKAYTDECKWFLSIWNHE